MAFAGFLLSALGVCAMALVAPEQDYLMLLPGLAAFGVGLAMSSSPITTTAISEATPRLNIRMTVSRLSSSVTLIRSSTMSPATTMFRRSSCSLSSRRTWPR